MKKLFKEFVTINYNMKYHRYRYSFNKWVNRKRKWDPLEHEKKGQKYYDILPSLYYTNQTYGALNKYWLGFTIVKANSKVRKAIGKSCN